MMRYSLGLRVPAWRAGIESLFLSIAGSLYLYLLRDHVSMNLIWQLLFLFLIPLGAVWFALRWRLPQGNWWQQIMIEAGVLIPWSVILMGISVINAVFLEYYPATNPYYHRPLVVPFLVLCMYVVLFLIFRSGARLWKIWDRLCDRVIIGRFALAHLAVLLCISTTIALLFLTFNLVHIPALVQNMPPTMISIGMYTIVMMGLLVPPSSFASYLSRRRATRRLRALLYTMRAWRRGELSRRVSISGTDDIAQLQRDFNRLVSDLERTRAELESEHDIVNELLQSRRELITLFTNGMREPLDDLNQEIDFTLELWDAHTSQEQREALVHYHQETKHLQLFIDDLYHLGGAQAGGYPLDCTPTNIHNIVSRAVAHLAPLIQEKCQVELATSVSPDLPAAMVDEHRAVQIVEHLVHHELTHVEPGGKISINASAHTESQMMHLQVIGSPLIEEKSPTILHEGTSLLLVADDAMSSMQTQLIPGGSLSVALSLAHEWAVAMGGAIKTDTIPGGSQQISVMLPLAT
jgi:signal transduction histidine kinase